ncbi:CamS family sex pheromone protein [Salinicoccus sp. HZC-1]|uniref:CamS family sex pheromone protein n=1 Tax=Salinicoccus sp. HZC-1 TaxID=3385497 RepID=UPI00398B47CC
MKKIYLLTPLLLILLASCGTSESEVANQTQPAGEDENEMNSVPVEEQEEMVTSEIDESPGHYQTIIPYQLSPSRGLTSSNMVSSYNIETFEKGLFDISKTAFSTENHVFREGQVFTEEMVRGFLNRSYTSEEIDAMSEEEKADNNAFSNLGLNPSKEGETDPEKIAQEAPIYLSHILEQNYMIQGEEGNPSFSGMTIGLAMNSEYYYQKEQYGPTFTRELDEQEVRENGEQMAAEILERIRANEQYKDLKIVFGIFIQSGDTDITPGHFLSTAVVEPGNNEISSFTEVNENYVSLPSSEAGKISEEINSEYQNFNRKLESYFDSFTTSIGQGYFKEGELEHLSIEIPLEYSSRGEVIGLTQYVSELIQEHFRNTEVEISIKDKSQSYALITKSADNKLDVHIYE